MTSDFLHTRIDFSWWHMALGVQFRSLYQDDRKFNVRMNLKKNREPWKRPLFRRFQVKSEFYWISKRRTEAKWKNVFEDIKINVIWACLEITYKTGNRWRLTRSVRITALLLTFRGNDSFWKKWALPSKKLKNIASGIRWWWMSGTSVVVCMCKNMTLHRGNS